MINLHLVYHVIYVYLTYVLITYFFHRFIENLCKESRKTAHPVPSLSFNLRSEIIKIKLIIDYDWEKWSVNENEYWWLAI